jgi:hypothetical protein
MQEQDCRDDGVMEKVVARQMHVISPGGAAQLVAQHREAWIA